MSDSIVAVATKRWPMCGRYGIARLWVLGSTARGEARPHIDLGLPHEVAPGARLGWEPVDLELGVIFEAKELHAA